MAKFSKSITRRGRVERIGSQSSLRLNLIKKRKSGKIVFLPDKSNGTESIRAAFDINTAMNLSSMNSRPNIARLLESSSLSIVRNAKLCEFSLTSFPSKRIVNDVSFNPVILFPYLDNPLPALWPGSRPTCSTYRDDEV